MRILIVSNGSNPFMDPALKLGFDFVRQVNEAPIVLKVLERKSDPCTVLEADEFNNIRKIYGMVDLQIKARVGYWSEEIIEETKTENYDLVILGEKKISGRVHIHDKSQVVQITEQVPCSVLIVRGQAEKIQRILLCDSGAAHLATLNRFTDKMEGIFVGHEDITVLHVMSQISAGPGVSGKQLRADAEVLIGEHSPEGDLLLQDIQALQKSGFHPVPKIRHGLVLDEILNEAQAGNYDLVVIGAHRYEGLSGYLLDNLARKLIKQLDRSVLVLK